MAEPITIQTFSVPIACFTAGDGDDARHNFIIAAVDGDSVLICKQCGCTWFHDKASNTWRPILFDKEHRTQQYPPFLVIP